MTQREIIVRVADLRVGKGHDVLVTVGLGSCVAILLVRSRGAGGGLAHILLPSQALSRTDQNAAKFPQTAIPHLIDLMAREGANPRRVTADWRVGRACSRVLPRRARSDG